MKNIFKLLPLLLLLFSCEQGIIFHDIALEIKLEEPNILGNINSIVELNEKLYTQNGNIYTKPLKTVRGWTTISKPGRVIALASNEAYLYALTASQTDDEGDAHKYQVWASQGGTGNNWVEVAGASSTSTIVLFDNGVNGNAGRNAYVRVGSEVKGLTDATMGGTITDRGAGASTVASASLAGTDYFSDTRAFCSDGTDTLYSVRDEKVKTSATNNDDSWTGTLSVTDATVMVYADNKLYVGTEEGLEQVSLDAVGGSPSAISNLPSNAEATTGENEITAIGYFSDEDDNAVYAAAIEQYSTMDNGLWGYYPSRGNWNFE